MNFDNKHIGYMATHSAKLFQKKGTQAPVCASIRTSIPSTYISSATIKLDRLTWLDPSSIQTKDVNITDVKTKQITVSFNNNQDTVAITPMTAIGLYYEIYKREIEAISNLPATNLIDICVVPNPKELKQYNEVIGTMKGHVKSFSMPEIKLNSLSGTKRIDLDANSFVLSVRLKNASLSSNLIAVGLPSITAIAGFFMYMENKTGISTEFAIGIKSTIKNLMREPLDKRSTVRGLRIFDSKVDQRNGDIELCFVIRCQNSSEANYLKHWIQNSDFKLAGGDVLYKAVSDVLYDDCCWIYEADPLTVQKDIKDRELFDFPLNADPLDYALILNRSNFIDSDNKYTVSANGYAFLGKPSFDPNSRAKSGLHVWAEVIYSVVYLNRNLDPKKGFWSKKDMMDTGLLYWSSLSK